jgi:hypothetical protein
MNYITQSVLSIECSFGGKNKKFARNCIAQSVGQLGRKGYVVGK